MIIIDYLFSYQVNKIAAQQGKAMSANHVEPKTPNPLEGILPLTAEGQALVEVVQVLLRLEQASSFIRNGVQAYLRTRSTPAFIVRSGELEGDELSE